MIEFEGVHKRYAGGQNGLLDINFVIQRGEMVFVTGHSGAGKSTLIKLIALLEGTTRGQVRVDGQVLGSLRRSAAQQHRRTLGMVFQDYRLLHRQSIFDNVALPLRIAGWTQADIDKRVRAVLDLVGLGARAFDTPLMLSGGEQQRVGIARALAPRPALIIADEPTGNLDPKLATDIMQLFISLMQAGTTVVVASHDLHLIQRVKKRVLVLDKGRLIDDFRPEAAT